MPLEEYRKKRKFKETPEPAGRVSKSRSRELVFVVQKHDATSLHYDFRLEVNGVMVSWAVPKGPSLNPAEKRLAMMTEDHPLEYNNFEGVIPEGHYGAGPVMVWDRGIWRAEGDQPADKQIARGELKFVLLGEKLRGGFVLVRTSDKKWLLIKHRDDYVDPAWDIHAAQLDRSVLSGRTLKEIAAGRQPKKRTRSAA
jgi:bifunctional non-homologous end joining protein LigD